MFARRLGWTRVPLLAGALVALLQATTAFAGGDPGVAPVTSLSSDGRSATDGTRTLSLSTAVMDPAGGSINVSGSGYNTEKGIYLAFCVIPPLNEPPSPCGGGADIDGGSSASIWISSNPPIYGEGLAIPYGSGGSFNQTVNVSANLSGSVDCRAVQCAIVTRNDHTRSTDRSQDIFVPLTFATEPPTATPAPPTSTPTTPPADEPTEPAPGDPTATNTPPAGPVVVPSVAPASTAAGGGGAVPQAVQPASTNGQPSSGAAGASPTAPTGSIAAPIAAIVDGGRTARAGSLALTVSKSSGLSPSGQELEVAGEGFDPAMGVYVALCAVESSGELGACSAGKGASAWVSSNPPAYAEDLAIPYEEDGSFEVTLNVKPRIDSSTDCTKVTCAIVARPDDTIADDRSQELAVPVTFVSTTSRSQSVAGSTSGSSAPAAATADDDGGSGTDWWMWAAGAVVLVLIGGAGYGAWQYQQSRR